MTDEEFPDLYSLIGEELSSVSFVRDYIELCFDGPIVRCLADITVSTEGTEIVAQSTGFRDALCGVIGSEVVEIESNDCNQIHIKFEKCSSLFISGNELGTEFAHFLSFPNRRLQVWDVEDS